LDFETATSHQITVMATPSDGSSQTANFIIAVAHADAPLGAITGINPATDQIQENSHLVPGATTGLTVRTVAPDAGDTVTHSLTNNAGDRFAINPMTGVVTVSGALNYDGTTRHQITVVATSSGGGTQSLSDTTGVTNVNDVKPKGTSPGPITLPYGQTTEPDLGQLVLSDADGDVLTRALSVNHGTLTADALGAAGATSGIRHLGADGSRCR
jgi:hypothetical protein